MTEQELFHIKIEAVSQERYKEVKAKWDTLSKPLDGLGDFEDVICQIAAIQGRLIPELENRTLLVFCADNGIVKRGVTQSDREITRVVATALGEDRSASSCLAKSVHAKVLPVDIGICFDREINGVLNRKIALGTRDFLEEPAMTGEQLLAAIEAGIALVEERKEKGDTLLLTGEMGIGNTTTTAAVLAALLKVDSDDIVGRGAGLDDQKLLCKRQVVKDGIAGYEKLFLACPDEQHRCFEIVRCLGGFDIAAMCGVFIGGAIHKIPVVIDGVISSVAALLADCFVPRCRDYMIASHSGRERGTAMVLDRLNKKPFLYGNMALGEGTGALLLLPLLDSALYYYVNGTRFSDNGIEDYIRFGK